VLEIARQMPAATRVAGFWTWKNLGRSVNAGAKGIRILAPMVGARRRKGEEAGADIMRDPEMGFELGLAGGAHLNPFYYRNEFVAVEQWSRNIVRDRYVHLVALHEQHVRSANTWDNNLRLQGFAEAFTDKCILG
jgi:hypothetical protein